MTVLNFARESDKQKYIDLSEEFRAAVKDGSMAYSQGIAKELAKLLNNYGNSRCPECGFKIRGPGHFFGPHHKSGGKKDA